MEDREYRKLTAAEDRMWWFAGLHANLIAAYRRNAEDKPGAVLDAGCGTGGLLRRLADLPDAAAFGVEIAREAAALARAKSGRPVTVGSVAALPFPDDSFAGVFSADVLCHRGVDEAGALAEFRRVLAPGGLLVMNLPAYRWLLSDHDRAVDNVRRYHRRDLTRMVEASGLALTHVSYWNTVLFPLMVARRKVLGSRAGSDVMMYPRPIEAIFTAAMRIEHAWLRRGRSLPFGGSLMCVAMKPWTMPARKDNRP